MNRLQETHVENARACDARVFRLATAPPHKSSIDPPTNGTPVLVVDDEAHVGGLISRWLAQEGCRCAQAANVQAGWQYLQDHEVHLVTLDVRMPGEPGTALLPRIVAAFPDTAVMMMTGQGDAQTVIESLTQGACAYLLKPVVREELVFHARRALERRQLIMEKREHTQRLEDRVRQQTAIIRRREEETIHRLLSASLLRDEETGSHIRRVGLLSELLAAAIGWSAADVESIRLAAPMHDVGKIGIPDAILRKRGPLTGEEYAVMQTHTLIGGRILSNSESPMLKMAQEIALCHHERWDGGGYPAKLPGDAIPESARIVAIADVYDALSHDRVYRPAMPEEKVLSILQEGAGTQFDPHLLATFFSHFSDMCRICKEHPDEPSDVSGALLMLEFADSATAEPTGLQLQLSP
jgi:putative two-component system response regulator